MHVKRAIRLHLKSDSSFLVNNKILLPNRCREGLQSLKKSVFTGFFQPLKLFPLNGRGGLGAEVVEDAADAGDLGLHAAAIFSAQCAAVRQCVSKGPGLHARPSRSSSIASFLISSTDWIFLCVSIPWKYNTNHDPVQSHWTKNRKRTRMRSFGFLLSSRAPLKLQFPNNFVQMVNSSWQDHACYLKTRRIINSVVRLFLNYILRVNRKQFQDVPACNHVLLFGELCPGNSLPADSSDLRW